MQPEEPEVRLEETGVELPTEAMSAVQPVIREPFWGYTDLALVLGLLFALSVVVAVGVGLLAIPYPSLRLDPTPLAMPVQIAVYGALYLSFWMVLKQRYGKPVFASLGWRRSRLNLVFVAVGGIVMAFAVSALGVLFRTPKIASPFDKLMSTKLSLAAFAVVAVVLAPLFEELLFRGFIQPLFSRTFGTIAGIVLTAALFGALHGFEYSWVWQYALLISLVGVVLGILRTKTNSIIPSTVMHGFFNAVSMAALAFGKNI